MPKLQSLTGFVVAVCLSLAAPAHADVVSDWNAVTMLYCQQGDSTAMPPIPAGRPGAPPGTLDVALVHLAMHDAVQAIEGAINRTITRTRRSWELAHRPRPRPPPRIAFSYCSIPDSRRAWMISITRT